MELKDFISETLISIIEGVTIAQGKAEARGAFVNPTMLRKLCRATDLAPRRT
jgi:hypothetical protein